MAPTTKGASRLLLEGAQVLSRMEHAGIKVDVDYLTKTTNETAERIASLSKELRSDKVYDTWRKRYGVKANLNSREQLGEVVFGLLGHSAKNKTATGRFKTEEEDFVGVELPFVTKYFELQKLQKLHGTYLRGLMEETVNGYIHPVFNLHLVSSYRSSCSEPNVQNLPARQAWIADLLRRCFVARRGRRLVEIDFSGIEVRVSACVHKDPTLIRYVKDPTTDMHRDTACELFLLDPSQVEKKTTRDWSKNRFVFPQFYGSVWFQCAPHLWEGVATGARLPNGFTVKQHLKTKGIHSACKCRVSRDRNNKEVHEDPKPGTFCHHVQKVEKSFWQDRFTVYTQWKREFYDKYLTLGHVDLVTGFRCSGVYKRNEVLNLPIQGPAFHCLLQASIYVQRELDRRNLRTMIVNEIHDSLWMDVPEEELQEVIDLTHDIMTCRLPKRWDWIVVPLDAEVDVTPVGGSIVEKRQWARKEGIWSQAS